MLVTATSALYSQHTRLPPKPKPLNQSYRFLYISCTSRVLTKPRRLPPTNQNHSISHPLIDKAFPMPNIKPALRVTTSFSFPISLQQTKLLPLTFDLYYTPSSRGFTPAPISRSPHFKSPSRLPQKTQKASNPREGIQSKETKNVHPQTEHLLQPRWHRRGLPLRFQGHLLLRQTHGHGLQLRESRGGEQSPGRAV